MVFSCDRADPRPSCGAMRCSYRQAKDGQWVKRWLELDDDILCSYKSSDKLKILNAVNLKKARPPSPGALFFVCCSTA